MAYRIVGIDVHKKMLAVTVGEEGGRSETKVRNRMRSVTKKVIAIGLALRHKGKEGELKRQREYRQLLRLTRQILLGFTV
jgi:hypothetical protein